MPEFTKVAELSSLPEGEMTAVEVGGESVLLTNVGGEIYAVSETCTHEEAPLSEGYLDGNELVCSWHSSVFDVVTGQVVESPAMEGLKVFSTRVEGNDILVAPPDD